MTGFIPTFGYSPFNPAGFAFKPNPNIINSTKPFNPSAIPTNKLTIGGQVIDTTFVSGLAGSFGIDLKKFIEKNPELASLIDLGLSKIGTGSGKTNITVNAETAVQAFLTLLENNAMNMAYKIYKTAPNGEVYTKLLAELPKINIRKSDWELAVNAGASYGEKVTDATTYANALPIIAKLEPYLRAMGVDVDSLIAKGVNSTYQQVNNQGYNNTGSIMTGGLDKYLLPAAIVLAAFVFMKKK
jgi:hypothetical protein